MSASSRPATDQKRLIVGVAGRSGTPKKLFCSGVASALGRRQSVSISGDRYHRYGRRDRWRLGMAACDPVANDLRAMLRDLEALKAGNSVQVATYDHDFEGTIGAVRWISPAPVLLVEGLLVLHMSELRDLFSPSVYLELDEDARQARVVQSYRERGYADEQIRDEEARREPFFERYIKPQRQQADIVIKLTPRRKGDLQLDRMYSIDVWSSQAPQLPWVPKEFELLDGRPMHKMHVDGTSAHRVRGIVSDALKKQLGLGVGALSGLGEIGPTSKCDALAIGQMAVLAELLSGS